jgi:predicted transposase YdaD
MTDDDDSDVPRNVHDGIFKAVFGDPARAAQELQAVLPPALVASIDWETMAPMPTSFVDEVFRQRTGDLVYEARFTGGGAVILWLLEHQSTEDWWMLERVLDTMRLMWRQWRRLHEEARHLPVIVPVVVYNGARPWRAPRSMHDLYGLSEEQRAALGSHALSCDLVLDDLSAIEDQALRSRHMDAYGRLALFTMARAAVEDFLDRLQEWQLELRMVFRGEQRWIKLQMVYIYRVHQHTSPETIHARIAALVGPEQEEAMRTAADVLIERGFNQGIEKGIKKGIERGIEKGREQERRALLLRQLGRRFGAVPAEVAARVEAAPVADLDVWLDRILDAPTLEAVFGDV